MNLPRTHKAAAIIAFGILAFTLAELSSTESTKKTKVHEIKTVKLSVSGAAKIKVVVAGTVGTGGWTEAELVASATRAEKPENSDVVTVHFDFVATKPTGVVTQVITPISAETSLPAPGAGKTLKVIVHSETNEKEDSIKSPLDPP